LQKEDNDWVKKCMKWRVPDQEFTKEDLKRGCAKRLSGT